MNEYPKPQGETIYQIHQSLQRATEAVGGDPNVDPLSIFPDPAQTERREDVVFEERLTPDQEHTFRAAMAELGPGREEDLKASDLGLQNGYNAVLEGGQVHKMMAELRLVLEDEVQPRQIIITGASGRKIGDKEKELTAKLLGITTEEVGGTEFDVACQVIKLHPKFEPFLEDAQGVLGGDPSKFHAKYDLVNDFNTHSLSSTGPEDSGQFVQLGIIAGTAAVAMRIDRFPHPDFPNDPTKYVQPSNAQKLAFASHFISADDAVNYGEAVNDIALVTSATYEPSCLLAALEAEDSKDGRIRCYVTSYGTKLLAAVKDTDPVQPSLNQLAGEAYKTAKLLAAHSSQA